MKQRPFGRTGHSISDIGFGAWAIGGAWGDVSSDDAKAALHAALDAGTNFIDTADVYGDGRSERFIAEVLRERGGDKPYVATKAGRRLSPHAADGYNEENLLAFVERSLVNLDTDCLDLVQLHCPPPEVYYRPEVFDVMDRMVTAGKIRHYGVSVEKVEEALKAIEYPNVASIQIIYNIFRQRPNQLFFAEAKKRDIGVIVRVPLASGVLTGKMSAATAFAADDHRAFNRHGEAFDMGETFSGVPYELALEVVEEIRRLVPGNATMAQFALRWILMEDSVSSVIPGARNAQQAAANSAAGSLPALPVDAMDALRAIYQQRIAPFVHQRW
ncbi:MULTISPECIES: aldo/keto reductase [unclassified Janthinobacterium]|uniref:aldo/keto reductase n=1 Tax=unclassified Janthinobacterium TaxID=2610881 RepID=UPI0003490412|nr:MULTISPECIES: aldo/keto reductase [unclassified Janthinobacterium]MEC5159977.1 aryl-alcohol dehydrogenase-like predicted oxidoreductase [Janthinobacterium sp. CG_S6]